ncbi:hypothetical protein WR25_16136 isoform G [Diploscapter pachys]|uniref:glutamine--fructose-6-phosphate transaminase (isomerizing) n=1 Tax=Diploscapter pachys TaxID=2018661 RepID=A0A2A2LAY0_9BILA|nr:hypothetical protein WR25_16136 isoform B [Diploscapter pachys]PAV83411.1 hypothetical protein WR25_16136 isoform G [Diploscapter pachys]
MSLLNVNLVRFLILAILFLKYVESSAKYTVGKLAEDFHALTEEENDELQSTCGIWKKDDFGTEPELQSSFDTNIYQRNAIQKQKIKVVTKKPIHRVTTPKNDAERKKRKAGFVHKILNAEPTKNIPPYTAIFETHLDIGMGGNSICSGTFISRYHYVTAAHCIAPLFHTDHNPNVHMIDINGNRFCDKVQNTKGRTFRVNGVADDSYLIYDTACDSKKTCMKMEARFPKKNKVNVKRAYLQNNCHDYWNGSYFDVAILELHEPIMSSKVIPACLRDTEKLPDVGTLFTVHGYGQDVSKSENIRNGNKNFETSGILRKEVERIVKCDEDYFDSGTSYFNTFCTRSITNVGSSCYGDSGGGGILHENGRCYIIGTVSRGPDCSDILTGQKGKWVEGEEIKRAEINMMIPLGHWLAPICGVFNICPRGLAHRIEDPAVFMQYDISKVRKMCGIFAYINYLTPKKRAEIIEILIQGLQRMEYRGYDSAGIAIDGGNTNEDAHKELMLVRKVGKVSILADAIKELTSEKMDTSKVYNIHCGIAHTRWATHGQPKDVNSHPQRSNDRNEFVVVHNGILTNYREIKEYLTKKGHRFESETDTEVIAVLTQHIHDRYPNLPFRQLVEIVIQQLEGAFALAFKSTKFPGQLVATRRGSPLLVGIKSNSRLKTNHFPVSFSKDAGWKWAEERPSSDGRRFRSPATYFRNTNAADTENTAPDGENLSIRPMRGAVSEDDTTTSVIPVNAENWAVEYFLASDAAAIVEHTKQVIFLEDDDVAFVDDGSLTIHRISRQNTDTNDSQKREVHNLNMELQEIMKGSFKTFMQKEIFEQPDSVINTMRGRVLPNGQVVLGGIKDYLPDIKRCRRLIMVACGTSYHSAIACRQILEELSELPVVLELASDFLDRQTPIFRDDVCIFVSQSGETADTLMALRYCKPRGALTIGITNTVGSSICRESHCGVHINAGPEIGVASTKAYTSQILALLMLALTLCDDRISMQKRRTEIVEALNKLPEMIREVLKLDDAVAKIADDIYKEKSLLIMGRGFNFSTCLEGALKIKELSYMHCEGIMSGELKHGPLAMVDENLRICMVICQDGVYKKSLNALQQVVARRGAPIIIADQSVPQSDLADMPHILRVPTTVDCVQSILTVIPLQLLSYHIAEKNGQNVAFRSSPI